MGLETLLINLLTLGVAGLGLAAFLRYPLNIGLIVAALNSVFLLLPMFLYVNFQPSFLAYAMSSLGDSRSVFPYVKPQAMTALTCAAWLVGAWTAQHVRVGLPRFLSLPRVGAVISTWRATGLFLLCVALVVYFVATGGFSLLEVISPSRKTIADLYGSYWISTFLIYVPAILAALTVAGRGKVTPRALLFLTVAVLVAFGTGQRRTIFLLVLIVFFSLLASRAATGSATVSGRQVRRAMVLFLTILAPLGPLLWAARNYFTQLAVGFGAVTNPFVYRGFWELFFGSAATGFRTAVSVLDMWEAESASPGYSFSYVLAAPIPRAIWHDKPIAPDGVLQDFLNIPTNPSLFVAADLMFNFFLFAPFAALIFAFAFSRPGVVLWQELRGAGDGGPPVSLPGVVLFAIYVSGAIVLFKNGLAPFVIFVLSTSAMLLIVAALTVKRKRCLR